MFTDNSRFNFLTLKCKWCIKIKSHSYELNQTERHKIVYMLHKNVSESHFF